MSSRSSEEADLDIAGAYHLLDYASWFEGSRPGSSEVRTSPFRSDSNRQWSWG